MQEFTKQFVLYFYPFLILFLIIDLLLIIFYKKIIGKAGEFIGCSNYSKCKFIKK